MSKDGLTLICCWKKWQPTAGESINSNWKLLSPKMTNKRFAFNVDHTMIRANQGHSVSIELGYEPSEPPEFLFHGSVPKFIDSIKQSGLEKRSRHDVHLSESIQTATKVGQRRGEAVILTIHSGKMHRDGFEFRVTPNQVWLTTEVPPKYIDFPE